MCDDIRRAAEDLDRQLAGSTLMAIEDFMTAWGIDKTKVIRR